MLSGKIAYIPKINEHFQSSKNLIFFIFIINQKINFIHFSLGV